MKVTKRKRVLNIFLLLLAIFLGGLAQAQEKPKSVKKQRKEFLELQEDRGEGADEAKKKDIEKHQKIQTKETQKRMKKNKKKSERLRKNKHEKNFFQRLFTKKPKRH
jgi:Ni/Co efflux regulator RcnB